MTLAQSPAGPWILLAEDQPADAELLKLGFEKAGAAVSIEIRHDGRSTFDWLQQLSAAREKATLPVLIIADRNLPGLDGVGLVRALKATSVLRRLPVLLLTSANTPREIAEAYDAGANGYLEKPVGLNAIVSMAAAVKAFWVDHNVRPPRDGLPGTP